MALFGRKQPPPEATVTPPTPINLATASPVVLGLAQTPALGSAQKIEAVAEWARLSGAPAKLEELLTAPQGHAERPWYWLADAQRAALQAGEYRVAVAALFWAVYYDREPALHNDRSFQLAIFAKIPESVKISLIKDGKSAAQFLPDDFPICGDESGQMTTKVVLLLASESFGANNG